MARPEPAFSPDAVAHLRRFSVSRQRRLLEEIRVHLVREDPAATTRAKFRLRRASQHADYELRVDDMRVFYRLGTDPQVTITLIGVKRGNRLLVAGKEFEL